MFPGTLISRLKQFLTGSSEGNDRKRKSVVPLDSIDVKKARMTKLSSIPAPVEEGGRYRSLERIKQNGAHPYTSSSAMETSLGSSARCLSDLTDMSQFHQPDGANRPFNVHRAVAKTKPVSDYRPMSKRNNSGPPMLIPIKQSSSSRSAMENEYLRYSGTQKLSRQSNEQVPTLLPIGVPAKPMNSIKEVTSDFKHLLRTKYSTTLNRIPTRDDDLLSQLQRDVHSQNEAVNKYQELMKKFLPTPKDPPVLGPYGQFNRSSLNGGIQRSRMVNASSIETIDQTDDEEDDLGRNEDGVTIDENIKITRFFTTIDPKQFSLVDEEQEQENREQPVADNVNTMKEKLQTKHVFRDNIIQDVQQRYGSLFHKRQGEIAEERERLNILKKNTEEQESLMRNKMLNYVCSFYKFDVLDETELKESTPEPQEIALPVLTQAQLDLIHRKLRSGNEVVADRFNLKIRGNDLETLQGANWLNDEVINFYMELLRERSELKCDQGLPKVHTMNTFFLPRLLQAGHSGVRRWTRKVDVLGKDMIVVPVHVNGIHWCMSIIDLRRKAIHYYDSMGSPNNIVLNALENYLCEESLDKRKSPFDTNGLTKANIRDCPRQQNGSDCGVFSCMFAEFLTRDHPITFDQSSMQYFRQKMMVEIVQGQLLT